MQLKKKKKKRKEKEKEISTKPRRALADGCWDSVSGATTDSSMVPPDQEPANFSDYMFLVPPLHPSLPVPTLQTIVQVEGPAPWFWRTPARRARHPLVVNGFRSRDPREDIQK